MALQLTVYCTPAHFESLAPEPQLLLHLLLLFMNMPYHKAKNLYQCPSEKI